MYPLRYLSTGHIFMDPADDCDRVVDAMLETGYSEEFCLAKSFDVDFISRLMEAGFLVMATEIKENANENKDEAAGEPKDPFYLLLPKLHLVRSALFFRELHIKKSVRPYLSRYELQIDTDFDLILDKCVEIHGSAWLIPPLVNVLKKLHRSNYADINTVRIKPVSFAVYREGELKAGEIGIAAGRVYTSYSGYYEEDNAGTVQMIKMAQWLEKTGFDFLDLGMPLAYKTDLGAQEITPSCFVEIFRKARY